MQLIQDNVILRELEEKDVVAIAAVVLERARLSRSLPASIDAAVLVLAHPSRSLPAFYQRVQLLRPIVFAVRFFARAVP